MLAIDDAVRLHLASLTNTIEITAHLTTPNGVLSSGFLLSCPTVFWSRPPSIR